MSKNKIKKLKKKAKKFNKIKLINISLMRK